MSHSPSISRAGPVATSLAIALAASPAVAAGSYLPAEQWSTYLLFGSIALLIAGVGGKIIKSDTDSTLASNAGVAGDVPAGIGMYRNSVLVRR